MKPAYPWVRALQEGQSLQSRSIARLDVSRGVASERSELGEEVSLIHVSRRKRGAGTRHIAVQPNPEQDALTVALHFEDAQANMLPTQTLARKLSPPRRGNTRRTVSESR